MINHFVEKNKFLHIFDGCLKYPSQFQDTSFVVPVAVQAASIWIFSRSSFSYCGQLSQISLPYSKMGLIREMYIVLMDLRSRA